MVLDERGVQRAIGSLLDTPISLPAGDRPASRAIREIAAAVSKATGATILEGMLPLNVFQNSMVNIAADNEPAWSVLQRVLTGWLGPLAWRLPFDPGRRQYMLNIVGVTPPTCEVQTDWEGATALDLVLTFGHRAV